MSMLLSITGFSLFSLCYIGNDALQVASFGDAEQDWMVFGLAAHLDQTQAATGIQGSRGQHLQEVGRANVVGAGASDEDAAGAKHLEGAEVELLVATQRGLEVAFGFGERRGVENDGVVAAVGGGVVLEQVEGIGLDPFDFGRILVRTVEGGILVGDFQGGAGTVDGGDAGAARYKVEG